MREHRRRTLFRLTKMRGKMSGKLFRRHIDLEEYSIHYLAGGEPIKSSCPILFLHGWALSAEAFRVSLSVLAQDYRIIAPDLPGFGKSNSHTSSWDYDDYATAIFSFIKAIDIEKIHLIGHSMGGGISIVLAALAPSLVQSLILIDSAAIPIGSFSKLFFERLIELPVQTLATRFSPQHSGLISASLHNFLFRTENTSGALRLPLRIDLRPRLDHIKVPCLIVWGKDDRTIPLASGKELSQRIPGAELLIVENAHHEWSLLLPEKFASITSKFIDKVEKLQLKFTILKNNDIDAESIYRDS